jgi:hypothetical protein
LRAGRHGERIRLRPALAYAAKIDRCVDAEADSAPTAVTVAILLSPLMRFRLGAVSFRPRRLRSARPSLGRLRFARRGFAGRADVGRLRSGRGSVALRRCLIREGLGEHVFPTHQEGSD